MIAVPETTTAGREPATNKFALASLTADEKAELVWGDEANGATALRVAPSLHVGQWALCVDGRAGHVVKIMPDPSGRLRQVIVRSGWFWGREVSIPAAWIKDADRLGVHLAVDRRRLQALPDYRPDREIAIEGRIALREASLLDGADDGDITVTVCDGVAVLSGHVVGSRDKERAGQAMLTAGGVASVRNDLVIDEELVNLVAQALGSDERTRSARIFVRGQPRGGKPQRFRDQRARPGRRRGDRGLGAVCAWSLQLHQVPGGRRG